VTCAGRRFNGPMPQDPFIREKFTRERTAAKKLAAEYFERFPKERYKTEAESWRHLQSQNIEFNHEAAAGSRSKMAAHDDGAWLESTVRRNDTPVATARKTPR